MIGFLLPNDRNSLGTRVNERRIKNNLQVQLADAANVHGEHGRGVLAEKRDGRLDRVMIPLELFGMNRLVESQRGEQSEIRILSK